MYIPYVVISNDNIRDSIVSGADLQVTRSIEVTFIEFRLSRKTPVVDVDIISMKLWIFCTRDNRCFLKFASIHMRNIIPNLFLTFDKNQIDDNKSGEYTYMSMERLLSFNKFFTLDLGKY